MALTWASPAAAQTLTQSLEAAYSVNPTLNSARSALRAVDEDIAIARSGNRPNLAATFSSTTTATKSRFRSGQEITSGTRPTTIDLTFTQPLFQGFQVRNTIRQAEASVRAQRASLVDTEQSILLDAATAFEDVIENRQIVQLRRNDVAFLGEQVRAAQDRFEVGEGTRTDVSQAEARQAEARSALNFAVANLSIAEATFFQVTGLKARTLRDNFNVERLVPRSVDLAVKTGQQGHPAIEAALHDVDTALFNVKAIEGRFLPSVDVTGQVGTAFNTGTGGGIAGAVERADSASFGLNVTIPIYQGGLVSAQVRQAKEQLGTSRIQVDVTRDAVRQNTLATYAQYVASVRTIFDARTGVFAQQLALQGVIEEQRVGQRTTLDVLDSQRDLIEAQLQLISAERDKDVAAFALLSDVGRLTARRLGLSVQFYRPEEHTDAVRDKWFGFRTPDGR
ncbi:MAG: TolC family outer membrane protein [Pseudomonadota bacterium]